MDFRPLIHTHLCSETIYWDWRTELALVSVFVHMDKHDSIINSTVIGWSFIEMMPNDAFSYGNQKEMRSQINPMVIVRKLVSFCLAFMQYEALFSCRAADIRKVPIENHRNAFLPTQHYILRALRMLSLCQHTISTLFLSFRMSFPHEKCSPKRTGIV